MVRTAMPKKTWRYILPNVWIATAKPTIISARKPLPWANRSKATASTAICRYNPPKRSCFKRWTRRICRRICFVIIGLRYMTVVQIRNKKYQIRIKKVERLKFFQGCYRIRSFLFLIISSLFLIYIVYLPTEKRNRKKGTAVFPSSIIKYNERRYTDRTGTKAFAALAGG